MIELVSPESGAAVSLLTPEQRAFEALFDRGEASYERRAGFGFTAENEPFDRLSLPAPVVFSFRAEDAGEATVDVSEKPDMSDPVPYLCGDVTVRDGVTSVPAYNLETGKTYYWRVKRGGETSAVRSFRTADGPRFIRVPAVENVRDIGGYVAQDGKRIKDGLVYRGSMLDFREEYGRRIGLGKEGADHLFGALGVGTVIDLCGNSYEDPVPDGIRVIRVGSFDYGDALVGEQRGYLTEYLEAVLDPAIYPVYIHCAAGADRTGTALAFLEGILGVRDRDILFDYYVTALSLAESELENWFSKKMFEGMFAALADLYPGAETYSELITSFVLDLGIERGKLDKLRDFLLE